MKTSCLSEALPDLLIHRPIYSVPLWLFVCVFSNQRRKFFFSFFFSVNPSVMICFCCFSAEKKYMVVKELSRNQSGAASGLFTPDERLRYD